MPGPSKNPRAVICVGHIPGVVEIGGLSYVAREMQYGWGMEAQIDNDHRMTSARRMAKTRSTILKDVADAMTRPIPMTHAERRLLIETPLRITVMGRSKSHAGAHINQDELEHVRFWTRQETLDIEGED